MTAHKADPQDITDFTGLLVKGDLEKMREMLTIMQDLSNRIYKSYKDYVAKYGAEGVDMREVEQQFYKYHVAPVFGEDKLARLIAHSIVTGNYLI